MSRITYLEDTSGSSFKYYAMAQNDAGTIKAWYGAIGASPNGASPNSFDTQRRAKLKKGYKEVTVDTCTAHWVTGVIAQLNNFIGTAPLTPKKTKLTAGFLLSKMKQDGGVYREPKRKTK